jgi:DNA-binding response OmpR family regulator
VAQRHRSLTPVAPALLVLGNLTIDVDGHRASMGGTPIDLGRKEFALLVLLAKQPGRVVTHGAILDQVWGTQDLRKTDTLRVHVTQLRRKLGTGAGAPQILTEAGVGYRIVVPADSE